MAEPPTPAGFVGALRTVLGALPARRTTQLGLLTLLTLVNAAADLAMVAGAMLFLAALAGQPWPAPLAEWLPAAAGPGRVQLAALLFAGAAVATNLLRLLYLRLSELYVAIIGHELTLEIQRRVIAQPYDYHVRHHSSELIASLETTRPLAGNLVHQWLQTAAALATGLGVLALLVSVDPVPALGALAAMALLYLVVARAAARTLARNSAVFGQAFGERIRKVQESLGAIRDLKIDHSERAQIEDFRLTDARFAAASASTLFVGSAPRHVIEAAAALLVAALAWLMAEDGPGGALVLIGGIAVGGLRLLPLLQSAYRNWASVAANRVMLGQVSTFLRLPLPSEADEEPTPLPFRAAIRLDAVSFAYPERPEPVLGDVSLEIERGSRIAIAGETGSGKSTLADIIMGLLRPDEGGVLVDGVALDQSNIRAWQRNVAHVSQSAFLADVSIARNIAFSMPERPIDLALVRQAAKLAEIEDFVDSLPEGFDTEAGERGVRLSGGQRQRIAIARALYKQAPLMVLDEATNALDEATEARVLANLFADRERTIIIIAHRPAPLGDCRVVRLKDGQLIDQGQPTRPQ